MSKEGTKTPNSMQNSSDRSKLFDSNSNDDTKLKPKRDTSSPAARKANVKGTPYGHNERSGLSSSGFNSAGLESMSLQELESYAVTNAEETTHQINGCLKIAEEIREDATKTLVTLHQQGEQITRTHHSVANMDYDLSRGEKLLGNLGGIFSKTWKPKKTREIKGPVMIHDDLVRRRVNHIEQREKFGLSNPEGSSNPRKYSSEPTSALEKVEREKTKQDDALSGLSDVLGQLKEMAVDMGSEIERQNKAMDNLYEDADELNFRVKGANFRGRHLLKK